LKRIIILAIVLIILLPLTAVSQTRRRTSSKRAQRSASASSAADLEAQKMAEQVRMGAERVAEQIKHLTRFLYVYGGITKGLETAEDAARRNQSTPAVDEQTAKIKASIRTSFKDWREGLDKLEIDFRTTPGLQRYYTKLAGVAAGAATAEELAAANRYDQAGRSLLSVVNRLADVLVEMRGR
jgi:type II secretory pathway pseudopilin PulG